ncbi:MAG TPA: TOBE domain-containing protein, partial [bacterium]|nr:TOBE domain-containing protein [bacterium]
GHPPMNLLQGHFADGAFVSDGLRLALPFAVPPGPGTLGVRPEDVVLGGPIRGRVVVVEPHGRQTLVTVDAGGWTLKALADLRPAPGSAVGLGVDPARLHLFDGAGRRLEAAR